MKDIFEKLRNKIKKIFLEKNLNLFFGCYWFPQTLKTLDFGYFNKNVCKTPENIYTSKSQIFFENLEAIQKNIF